MSTLTRTYCLALIRGNNGSVANIRRTMRDREVSIVSESLEGKFKGSGPDAWTFEVEEDKHQSLFDFLAEVNMYNCDKQCSFCPFK